MSTKCLFSLFFVSVNFRLKCCSKKKRSHYEDRNVLRFFLLRSSISMSMITSVSVRTHMDSFSYLLTLFSVSLQARRVPFLCSLAENEFYRKRKFV